MKEMGKGIQKKEKQCERNNRKVEAEKKWDRKTESHFRFKNMS